MRKVIYGMNVSIDGCCDHTKFGGQEDVLKYFTELYRDVDLIVYGRKTYELMVPYWPEAAKDPSSTLAEKEYAVAFDAIDKLVFSRSLTRSEDPHSKIIHTDPVQEIAQLKQGPGKTISIGGVDIAAQIIAAGLVDEFHIVTHPVIVGEGRRLFDHMRLKERLQLKLAESKLLPSGCLVLRYERSEGN